MQFRISVSFTFLALILLAFLLVPSPVSSALNFSQKILLKVEKTYGSDALNRMEQWQRLIEVNRKAPIDEKLYEVNQFFNRVEFIDDIEHWKQTDYWATPIEFLGSNGGDCEDFTIAKYFTLIELGVATEKLRLMYVTATRPRQAHMVLAYYSSPNAVPYVLDNINKRILPASQRGDLLPIYSFNGDGLWLARQQGQGRKMQQKSNNSLWNDLNKRMKQDYE
jgi:predicted transglutaminase-like cysteine proteinase